MNESSGADEAILRNPWIFGVTATIALVFLASNIGETGTGQETSVWEALGIVGLMVFAVALVWAIPRLLGKPPHRVAVLRCVIAVVPYVVVLVATRFGAPQWPPGATLIAFVALMVFSLRSGRRSMAGASSEP